MLEVNFKYAYLIFEQEATKCPNGSKDEVEFINVLCSVRRSVLWCQQCLQQVAQGLNHADLVWRGGGRDRKGERGEARQKETKDINRLTIRAHIVRLVL